MNERPKELNPIPREASDAFLRSAIDCAELPSLLASLAQLTGDKRLIDSTLKPPLPASPAEIPPQGGMDSLLQARAKDLILATLIELRDSGGRVANDRNAIPLRELLEFITGPISDDNLELLKNELGVVADPDKRTPELRPYFKKLVDKGFRVAVIGAGMSGIGIAARLKEYGVSFSVFEKNTDVGGTWFENRYPGCRLDTSNFGYSYSFAQRATWQHYYSTRDEIHDYFSSVSRSLGLREYIRFETEVTDLSFDDSRCIWRLSYVGPDGTVSTEEFNVVVSAVGQLNRPKMPNIPGIDRFEGRSFHTAQWPDKLDLTGKRVAVIGTGASAYQVVPNIAAATGQLTVFQRHAPWATAAWNYEDKLPEGLQWLFRHVPYYHRWYRVFQFWYTLESRRPFAFVDPKWQKTDSVSEKNEELRRIFTGHIIPQYADRPDLLPKVIPNYPPYAKRPPRDNGTWAKALKLPHVELITDEIAEITQNGVRTSDGIEREFDLIVYATGFHASDFLIPMRVTGRDSIDLHKYWSGDARAYLGITIPGFPNLLCMYGPNTNLLLTGSNILMAEMQSDYILSCIAFLGKHEAAAMDLRQDIYDEFGKWVDEGNRKMAWGIDGVDSWYKNRFGRVSQNWPYTMSDYWKRTRAPNPDHYSLLHAR